jgi:hypothetical protein
MAGRTYYILKVKGKAKIPDYIQVRDEHFTLIGYFRPGRGNKHSRTAGNEEDVFNEKIEAACKDLPFGQILPVVIE